jgi:hypothetical protein
MPDVQIAVIADSDTRWKWGASLAQRLPAADATATTDGYLLNGRATPTDDQLDAVGVPVHSVRRVSMAQLVDRFRGAERTLSGDVIVLACGGGTIQAVMQGLAHAWRGATRRPVIVTGYVGLVYERLVDGLMLRAGADLVLANSAGDAARFQQVYAGVGIDPGTVVHTALPFLGGRPYDPDGAGRTRPYTVCFATQPSVPRSRIERRHALEQAAAYARAYPDRHVIIKLRARPGEQTTHPERHHYAGLLSPAELPVNLEFGYGSMAAALDRTDLCVTVSSTAALEALHRRIPTAVLTDFGLRESIGNQLFVGSGVLTSWPALIAGAVPVVDPEWVAANGVADPDPYRSTRDRLRELVAADILPALQPWFTAELAGAYLPGLLARNGLAADGSLLRTPPTAADRAGRRVVRSAARGVYRLGVRRFEPAVRRLAEL